jgi:hypothetical protein
MPSYVYVHIATPMSSNSINFCLCVFGTSNKFTAKDVHTRWDTIKQLLSKVGVKVVGVSSDGDSRTPA